jgi:hypothetical protein
MNYEKLPSRTLPSCEGKNGRPVKFHLLILNTKTS